MKYTSALITLLLFSLFANAQLKGDHGIFAKTPLALKKNQFQFEYNFQRLNVNNPGSFTYRDSGKVVSRNLDDYNAYSYLGFNLRYGITDRLEIAAELNHEHHQDFIPEVFNRFNFSTPRLQLKYQVNKNYIWKSKLAVFGGASFDVFDNTTRFNLFDTTEIYEFPFTNWYHLGVRLETKLHDNLIVRYGASFYRRYTEVLTFGGEGRWYNEQEYSFNAQYKFNNNIGTFAEVALPPFGGANYQFGGYYNFNESTQLIGAFYRDVIVLNHTPEGNYTIDHFTLGIYKSF